MAKKAPPSGERKKGRKVRPEPPAPPAAEAAEPHKHYDIDIYRAWCKACGICAAFCPRECLSLDDAGNPVVTRSDRCTGCGWCEVHCPDFAISVREFLEEQPEEAAY